MSTKLEHDNKGMYVEAERSAALPSYNNNKSKTSTMRSQHIIILNIVPHCNYCLASIPKVRKGLTSAHNKCQIWTNLH